MWRGYLVGFLFAFGVALDVFSVVLYDRTDSTGVSFIAGMLFIVGLITGTGAYVAAKGPYGTTL